MSETSAPAPTLASTLMRCTREMTALTERLDRVERQIETLYRRTGHELVGEECRTLQELDLVVQSIGALAGFIDHLARQVDDRAPLQIDGGLASVTLRDLAARLGGCEHGPDLRGATELF